MIEAIKKALRCFQRRKADRVKARQMVKLLTLNGHLKCPKK